MLDLIFMNVLPVKFMSKESVRKHVYRSQTSAPDLATHFCYALPMKGYTSDETGQNIIKNIGDIGSSMLNSY